jgi:hypothetical protein
MLGKDKVLCKTNSVQNKHNGKFGLEPILFEGQMLSDYLQDLVCNGRSVCSKGCVCFEQNLSCTKLCPCQALDLCYNVILLK